MGIDKVVGRSNVPLKRWETPGLIKDAVVSDKTTPVAGDVSPIVNLEEHVARRYLGNSQRQKAYKASKKQYTLVVGKDIQLDHVKHLSECALVGRMENVKVSFEALREWLQVHWKPILLYTPLFSTLINGWYIFHFLSAKDRENIEKISWFIGRGSMVLQRWSTNFNPAHSRVMVRHLLDDVIQDSHICSQSASTICGFIFMVRM